MAALAVASVIVSCEKSDDKPIPTCGEVSYEVSYSEDLRQIQSVGSFLPHTAVGLFGEGNLKLTTSAPLGFAKMSLICNQKDIIATLDFDEMRLMTDLTPQALDRDSVIKEAKVIRRSGVYDICGYPSRQTTISLKGKDGISVIFDIFSAVVDDCVPEPAEFDIDENFFAKERDPLLVTALNIRIGDSNVILMLKSVKPLESVDPAQFGRPEGFIEAGAKDIVALGGLM